MRALRQLIVEERVRRAIGLAAYLTVVLMTVQFVAAGAGRMLELVVSIDRAMELPVVKPVEAVRTVSAARLVPTNDDWNERLRDPSFWAGRRSGGNRGLGGPGIQFLGLPPGAVPGLPPLNSRSLRLSEGDTYRTVCVRLCDGSFVPVSFSTTRDQFDDDADKCARSCAGGGTRLFVYKNPGGEPADMEDVEGRPYSKLPTAFLYKTKYDPSCRCRPHPWEEAARDQHRVYALEAQRAKGDRAVVAELRQLQDKVRLAETTEAAKRKQMAQGRVDDQRRAETKGGRNGARDERAGRGQAGAPRGRPDHVAEVTPGLPAPMPTSGRPVGSITVMRGSRATVVTPGLEPRSATSGPFFIRLAPPPGNQTLAPRPVR